MIMSGKDFWELKAAHGLPLKLIIAPLRDGAYRCAALDELCSARAEVK